MMGAGGLRGFGGSRREGKQREKRETAEQLHLRNRVMSRYLQAGW